MTALDMSGHIDGEFKSTGATRVTDTGSRNELGIWVESKSDPIPHNITLQPANARRVQNLIRGGRRVVDGRTVYVNDGDLYSIQPSDVWQFDDIDGKFEAVEIDNRPWRNYCRMTVSRIDDA